MDYSVKTAIFKEVCRPLTINVHTKTDEHPPIFGDARQFFYALML